MRLLDLSGNRAANPTSASTVVGLRQCGNASARPHYSWSILTLYPLCFSAFKCKRRSLYMISNSAQRRHRCLGRSWNASGCARMACYWSCLECTWYMLQSRDRWYLYRHQGARTADGSVFMHACLPPIQAGTLTAWPGTGAQLQLPLFTGGWNCAWWHACQTNSSLASFCQQHKTCATANDDASMFLP